jgi:hypothetical protein
MSYGESLPGTSRPDIYQDLSTRNVREVITTDSY